MRRSTLKLALAVVTFALGNGISQAQSLQWEELGPNNTGNHVRAMAVDGSGTVWAGSIGGGLWKTTDQGFSWQMVSGLSDNLAVSSIAVDGSNIYVGTGEAYFYAPESSWGGTWKPDSLGRARNGHLRYTSQPGEGVFVSNDGGNTWTHNNGTWNGSSIRYQGDFISIQALATKSGNTLVGTLKGLYWSTDAALANVTKATGTNSFMNGVITDVDFANGNVVYACTKDSIYRSTDNGHTFGAGINSTFPVGTQAPNNRIGGYRMAVAVAPSNKDVIYLTGANDITGNCTGVWRSTDNGYNWLSISPYESGTFRPFQNKGLYSMFLSVPPTNANVCFIGGTKMYKFSDQSGWTDAASHTYFPGFSTRYVPAPQHVLVFDPSSDSTMYVAGDKEIVRSENWGRTYGFRTKGFNTAHLFGISASPSWRVAVSDRYYGISLKDNALASQNNLQYNNVLGASTTGGGIARWSITHPEYLIVNKAEDRGLQRSLTLGASFEDFYGLPLDSVNLCYGVSPDSMVIDRANTGVGGGGVYDRSTAPIMPFCLDEVIAPASLANDTDILHTPIYLYLATGNFVWVVHNPFGGIDSLPTWTRVTDDIVSPTTLPGGRKHYITAITTSGDATHTVYVGTNAGKIYRIVGAHDPLNLCVTTDVTQIDGGLLPNRWITDLEVDPNNADNLVVTFGAFAAGDDRVWITNDASALLPTFRSIQGNLQDDLPVHSAAFHPDAAHKSIVIGTEEGVYYTTSDYESGGGITWTNESSGVGNVPVTDIVYRRWYMDYIDASNYRYSKDNTLFIATHGRGAFKSSSLVSAPEQTEIGGDISIKAGPNPTIDNSTISFDLPVASDVKLQAYSIDGRPVSTLAEGRMGAGNHEVEFATKGLPAGMYLVNASFSNSKGVFKTNLRIVVLK